MLRVYVTKLEGKFTITIKERCGWRQLTIFCLLKTTVV